MGFGTRRGHSRLTVGGWERRCVAVGGGGTDRPGKDGNRRLRGQRSALGRGSSFLEVRDPGRRLLSPVRHRVRRSLRPPVACQPNYTTPNCSIVYGSFTMLIRQRNRPWPQVTVDQSTLWLPYKDEADLAWGAVTTYHSCKKSWRRSRIPWS